MLKKQIGVLLTLAAIAFIGVRCTGQSGGNGGGDGSVGADGFMPVLSGSCDSRTKTNKCLQYENVSSDDSASFQQMCSAGGGSWIAAGKCPGENTLGGCRTSLAPSMMGFLTTWYYPSATFKTMDDIKMMCHSPDFYIPNQGNLPPDMSMQPMPMPDLVMVPFPDGFIPDLVLPPNNGG